MIRLKEGVRLHGLEPQAVLGMMIVASAFRDHGRDPTFTSGSEGEHSPKSLHYVGRAFDVRLPSSDYPPADAEEEDSIYISCRSGLGDDWDCVKEKTHWHFEWDPKGPPR